MPGAAFCWFVLVAFADNGVRGDQSFEDTGPSYSNGMFFAAFALFMIVGVLLQLVVGRPIVNRLRSRRATLSAYLSWGALVGIGVLLLPLGWLVTSNSAPVLDWAWMTLLPAIVVFPVIGCFALAGVVERPSKNEEL